MVHITKSTTFNTWKKNANIEKIDFKVGDKYDLDKKNKAETSKGKEKAKEYKEIRERNRNIKCWKCQGIGHLSRDCPNKGVMIIKNGKLSQIVRKVTMMS